MKLSNWPYAACALVALAALGAVRVVLARDPQKDAHPCCHSAPSGEAPWREASARYDVPDVALTRSDGAVVSLRREIDDGKPVFLNFVFTTCTTVCPAMSRTFAQIQSRLGAERDRVHLISVSIDPEHDTPPRLAEYAREMGARPGWAFYTGTAEASLAAQRAFDVYRGDKMNHPPVTFLRVAPGKPWVRIEGFASAEELVSHYRRLVADRRGE
jgi:protein SCO1/2